MNTSSKTGKKRRRSKRLALKKAPLLQDELLSGVTASSTMLFELSESSESLKLRSAAKKSKKRCSRRVAMDSSGEEEAAKSGLVQAHLSESSESLKMRSAAKKSKNRRSCSVAIDSSGEEEAAGCGLVQAHNLSRKSRVSTEDRSQGDGLPKQSSGRCSSRSKIMLESPHADSPLPEKHDSSPLTGKRPHSLLKGQSEQYAYRTHSSTEKEVTVTSKRACSAIQASSREKKSLKNALGVTDIAKETRLNARKRIIDDSDSRHVANLSKSKKNTAAPRDILKSVRNVTLSASLSDSRRSVRRKLDLDGNVTRQHGTPLQHLQGDFAARSFSGNGTVVNNEERRMSPDIPVISVASSSARDNMKSSAVRNDAMLQTEVSPGLKGASKYHNDSGAQTRDPQTRFRTSPAKPRLPKCMLLPGDMGNESIGSHQFIKEQSNLREGKETDTSKKKLPQDASAMVSKRSGRHLLLPAGVRTGMTAVTKLPLTSLGERKNEDVGVSRAADEQLHTESPAKLQPSMHKSSSLQKSSKYDEPEELGRNASLQQMHSRGKNRSDVQRSLSKNEGYNLEKLVDGRHPNQAESGQLRNLKPQSREANMPNTKGTSKLVHFTSQRKSLKQNSKSDVQNLLCTIEEHPKVPVQKRIHSSPRDSEVDHYPHLGSPGKPPKQSLITNFLLPNNKSSSRMMTSPQANSAKRTTSRQTTLVPSHNGKEASSNGPGKHNWSKNKMNGFQREAREFAKVSYPTLNISPDAWEAIDHYQDVFLENLDASLDALASHRGSSEVQEQDVILFIQRATGKFGMVPLFALAEECLPRSIYRSLIPATKFTP